MTGELIFWGVIAVAFALAFRRWSNAPRTDAWSWQRDQEAVLERQQFQSWRNTLRESHLPLIKGDYTDYQPFMLDAEPSSWSDPKEAA